MRTQSARGTKNLCFRYLLLINSAEKIADDGMMGIPFVSTLNKGTPTMAVKKAAKKPAKKAPAKKAAKAKGKKK